MTSNTPAIDPVTLRPASREPVIDALAGFNGIPVNQWLPPAHPASTGQFLRVGGKPLSDYGAFRRKFSDAQVIDALAATAPNHCMDGWTFLSRALSALLSGDTHTARHLAYYAQLRAALSILSCNGIGIFNTINFVVDNTGAVHRIGTGKHRLGTHSAAWEVLQCWASEQQAARTFVKSLVFRGESLSNCIEAIWPSSGVTPLVSQVMTTWGADLKRAADGREPRNTSSYAAHALNAANSDLPARMELIRDIWLCLEPDGRGGFPSLDRHLLRKFLELMRAEQIRITSKRVDWEKRFPKLAPNIQELMPRDFLERVAEPADLIVFDHADNRNAGDVHAMLCRALLLLRTSTSIVRMAFVDAGFEPLADNMRPWFELIGIARGFWSDNEAPAEIADLWTDVDNAVSDLEESIALEPMDQYEFLELISNQAVLLSQTERACMWAVCA